MSAPRRPSSTASSEDNARKRVCKACDRCRLKKSKCDGSSPCSRCKMDNAICVFGERKKLQDKAYPKGYVEMLERQQAHLVCGLREMYRRLQQGAGWPGLPLKESVGGGPLTHDILERLNVLCRDGDDCAMAHEPFEDDLEVLQRKCLEANGLATTRRRAASEESEPGLTSLTSSHGSPSPNQTSACPDGLRQHNLPVTPPMDADRLPYIDTGAAQLGFGPSQQLASHALPGSCLSQSWMEPLLPPDNSMDFELYSSSNAMTCDIHSYPSPPTFMSTDMATAWYDPFNYTIDPSSMQGI